MIDEDVLKSRAAEAKARQEQMTAQKAEELAESSKEVKTSRMRAQKASIALEQAEWETRRLEESLLNVHDTANQMLLAQ